MIDSVLSPFAGGTGHPCTESLVYSLNRLGYDTGCDLEMLQGQRKRPRKFVVSTAILRHPIVGLTAKCW